MPNYNQVILIGHLTRDPELRYSAKGKSIAKVGIATTRKWKDEGGETREDTTFVDCDAFGKTADNLAQYARKGGALMLVGRLKLDQWEDKETKQKRQKLGVVVDTFQLLSRKDDAAQAPQVKQRELPEAADIPKPKDDGEDVPF